MSTCINLDDGAYCDVFATAPGIATMAIHDADGDLSAISFDRAKAREIVDAIIAAAGLAPVSDLAASLTGSLRILLQRIDDDLERIDPAAADRLRVAMIAHLRSKRPALLGGGVL